MPNVSMRKSHGFSSLCHALLLPLCLLCFVATIHRTFSAEEEREILLQFKGNVTDDPYGSLSSWVINGDPCKSFNGVSCGLDGFVEKIALWNTSLAGQLSPSLSGLKRLRVLTLFGNSFSGEVPREYGDLKSLWKINFSSNALSGTIPKFIGDLPNMRLLDLSGNGFSGEIPGELFDRCNKLKFVALSRNSLSGAIPESLKKCSELEGFDFSSNKLEGPIPLGLCREIPRLDHVLLGGNGLSGSVSSELSSCDGLRVLDLAKNSFTGSAPFSVLGSRNISRFNVSFNRFTGEIPKIATCGEGLEIFDASGNGLEGEIPAGVSKCKGLKILNLGFNELRGEIPAELSRLERLLVVQLGNNSMIQGVIPKEIASIQLLQVLDLSNLNLVGEIPVEITNSIFLRGLDVSGNALEGNIPEALYNMTYLEILDLHRNRLTGAIPGTIGNLSRLRFLDLSENSVSGPIPSSLGDLMPLADLNLSYNNLSGTVPMSLQRFGSSAYSGNPFLCGDPLPNLCSGSDRGKNEAKKKKKHLTVSAIIAIVAAAAILFGVCLVSIMNIAARRRKRRREEDGDRTIVEATPLASSDSNAIIIGKLVLFSKSLPSKYEDWESGTKALLDKECAIGAGSIGTVYKTTFEGSGISIAVKKLETLGRLRSQDEFEHEIGRLGSLRHPNLVALQGYYWSSSMQLILSEFVPNGNLYDKLHARNVADPELNWPRRFEIALGTARAISFLHNDSRPPILHLDVKSSNVLLDDNFECKLSDYGLGKLLPAMGYAVGYVAPELAQSSRLTSEKCDVYGFGVILLELVTGRKPVESRRVNEVVVLCEYVREVLERNSASDCFDGSLRGIVENELVQVMKLGLICTSEFPSRRPNMAEVVQFLESIRNGSESDGDRNQSSTSGGGGGT